MKNKNLRIINKHIKIGSKLITISGLGVSYTKKLLAMYGLPLEASVAYSGSVSFENSNINALIQAQTERFVEYKNQRKYAVDFLIKYNYYKGPRYTLGLPVRGQRTHTNAQTSRKNKNA